MPDMDGFKFLELVALEMDLPVIVMTEDKNINLVMKCAIHGACDCLKKPPQMEELQYIWQHVIRKKIGSKDQNKASNEEKVDMVGEDSQGINSEKNVDQNKMLGKKRNEQSEEEEKDDHEEDGQEDVDPSNQKKPRLAWKADLHKKFVAAVNQLGFENATPRKILKLMNTEGLTRENVASHLQKYRLSLKKKAQQPSMVLALGNSDQHGDFHSAAGSGRLSSPTIPSSYPSSGILCSLNSSSGVRPVQSQDMNCSINKLRNMQPSMRGVDSSALSQHVLSQKSSLLPSIPPLIDLEPLQQSSCTIGGNRQLSPIVDDSSGWSSLPSIPPLIDLEPLQKSSCTIGGNRQLSPIVDDLSGFTFPSCYPNIGATDGHVNNGYLDDIIGGIMKSGQNEMMMSGEMRFDSFPVGLCM